MKTLLDIVHRSPEPAPWSEGDNIPWDDPEFSERMLAEHLSQDHDLASRKAETIDLHVDWIFSQVLGSRPAGVLDLGCGPGFYSHRLARLGCQCLGIDFSPASIRYAKDTANQNRDTSCTYRHGDIRNEPFGEGQDLVMLIYGQINVFPRDMALEILRKAHGALKAGGKLLLEIQGMDLIRKNGQQPPSWYTADSGLFSATPHIVLQESFWHGDLGASTIRFTVIDAQTGAVESYALSNEAYTEAELDQALRSAGFGEITRYPSLNERSTDVDNDLPVVLATR